MMAKMMARKTAIAVMMKVRHYFLAIFTLQFKKHQADANHPPIPKHPTHPDLLIQNWPVSRAKTRTQLALIKDTHVVNPIPVIDRKGDLVMPKFYRQRLSGAEVRCHVSIQHWEITREKTDTYNVRLQ